MSSHEPETQIVREIHNAIAQTDPEQVQALVEAMLEANRIFVGGAGRSLLIMRTFAMRLMHIGLTSHVVGETITPAIKAGDLLVVASGSGQTRTTLAITEAAKTRGAIAAAITAHSGAPIAKMADIIVEIHSPITHIDRLEPSIQPPGSLFEQTCLIHCEGMVLRLMERLGTTEGEMRSRHTKLE